MRSETNVPIPSLGIKPGDQTSNVKTYTDMMKCMLCELANSGLLVAYKELMNSVNQFIEGNKKIFNAVN